MEESDDTRSKFRKNNYVFIKNTYLDFMIDGVKGSLYHNFLWPEIICFCHSMTVKKEKSNLLEDIKRLKQDKQALEVDLGKMKRERDQAKDQIAHATGKSLS